MTQFRWPLTCVLTALWLGLIPAFAADYSPYIQVEAKESYTDNVFLRPEAKDDTITTLSLWYRQPLVVSKHSTVRLKADVKSYHWARGSFDDTIYGLLGVEFRIEPDKRHELRWGLQHTTHDAYDNEAPFHTFSADEFTAGYTFPSGGRSTTELSYLISLRTWDSAASGRDGTAQYLGAVTKIPLGPHTDLTLLARHEKVDTRKNTDAFTRYWLGGGLARYFGRKNHAPCLSFDYRYSTRDYTDTTRVDHKNAYDLGLKFPLGTGNSLELHYSDANNDSTHAKNIYREHELAIDLSRRF